MTEPAGPSSGAPSTTAGGLLRAARERQGLHIAALAASIKVSPRKLDALERDRYDELPDPAFTRALAQTVCRTLKIDAAPVLALLPPAGPASLEHVAGSLNTPFRPGRESDGIAASAVRPLAWAGGALMLAALVIMAVPEGWWGAGSSAEAPALIASAPLASAPAPEASAAAASAMPVVADAASAVAAPEAPAASAAPDGETVFAAPPPAPGASEVTPAALLSIRVSETSWIEVQDARGSILLSRSVQPGEAVGLNGSAPLRLTVGNAAGTALVFRGLPVDLAASTRDNVARLELK
jgi:cytoskeleton protein RodZ